MEGEVKYAGFWLRVWAFILDIIVLSVVTKILGSFLFNNVIEPPDMNEIVSGMNDIPQMAGYLVSTFKPLIISFTVLPLVSILYWVLMTGRFGATLGKMAVGIKVVKSDLQPITFGGAFIREFLVKHVLFGVLFFISWLGFLWISWDKKKQGWHDKIAHTLVVKEAEPARPNENLGEVSPQ